MSYQHIHRIKAGSANLKKFPDFTNLVHGVKPKYWNDGQNKICFIPNSNMISAKNNDTNWKENYIDIFTQLITLTLALGLTPVLLKHEGIGDKAICNQLNNAFNNALSVIDEQDPLKVKGIIGTSKAIVCSRFHGCVSALSQGVPCLGTSWSYKYEQLFAEYDSSELLIKSTETEQNISALFHHVIHNQTQLKDRLDIKASFYKSQSEQMWVAVSDQLSNL